MRFENNFLAEKTKKLDAKLLQVRVQLERTSSAKLNERLNFQKAASDKLVLGMITHSSCSTSSSALNNVVFVYLASNAKLEIIETKIENVSEAKHDKGKYILGVPPKVVKETKQNNHCSTNKKSQPKKRHFCHHYEASEHTHPNCYKWLATQQSNSVLSFRGQNQLQNSFAPIGEFLKAMMFLTNFNWFNPPSYSSHQRSQNRKDSSPSKSPVWMEKDSFK